MSWRITANSKDQDGEKTWQVLCANGKWLGRERGGRDLSLLCFGQTATSIFSHPSLAQQDKERGEAFLHQLDTAAGDGQVYGVSR